MQELTPEQSLQVALGHYYAGNLSEAERICRQVVLARPDSVDVLHLLAFVLAARREWDEAVAVYRQALGLRPGDGALYNNLGVALAGKGQPTDAIEAYRKALHIDPKYTDALINLGACLADKQDFAAAIALYRQALEIDPDLASANNNLGAALLGTREFDGAIAAYQEAIRLKPDYADAHNNLGAAYFEMNRPDEALDGYQTALRLDPLHAAAHNNLGNLFLANGQIAEAIAAFREAIRLKPEFVDALCNLGIALMETSAYDEAAEIYAQARDVSEDAIEPHWNIACHALLHGDFQRGWMEYEWRWRTKARSAPRINYKQPTWYGEDLAGRVILLYTEQGYGDSIQFIRYATLVANRGGRVILRCPPELSALISGVAGIEQIVTTDDLPHFDLYCPLMTLPLVFSTQLETIPADVPYIKVDAGLREVWGRKIAESAARPPADVGTDAPSAASPSLPSENPGVPSVPPALKSPLKVGLVWAGGAAYKNDRKRSITLGQFAPLAHTPGVIFYSLQKGVAAAQIANAPAGMKLIDLTAELNDFAETAALISHLDLVIAVDTAVAHLAGALGKPVWLMIPTNPDWRWMLGRDDSPWYPTMRLFRQTRRGEWADVIERIAHALAGLCADSSPDVQAAGTDLAPRQLTTADAIAVAWRLHQTGRYSEAAGIYRQIIAQQPDNADALHLLGLSAMDARRPDMAAEWIGRAVILKPGTPDYQHSLGRALAAAGKFAPAIEAYQKVISLNPEFPDVYYNLGNALLKSKQYDEAISAFRQALKFRPEQADAHLNLGQALAHVSQHESATGEFREAIRLNPRQAEAHMNLGLALMQQKQMEPALLAARQAVAIDPQSVDSHWLLAAICLLGGDFEAGWKEYEWRWRGADSPLPPGNFPQPRWNGLDLDERTILLHAEQGLGDTIQFIRYAPLVARSGARVIVQCPPSLARLFKTVAGIHEIVPPGNMPACDVQCPLLSLPLIFNTRLESIPGTAPYVRADRVDAEKWAKRIAGSISPAVGEARRSERPGVASRIFSEKQIGSELIGQPGRFETSPVTAMRLSPPKLSLIPASGEGRENRARPTGTRPRRIGLVWAGGPTFKDDQKRSMPLLQFAPLARVPNAVFFSLQKGPAATQAAALASELKLVNFASELTDFADTAGLISQLDLVISVDTAVAHLAGALGKPVWILLPFDPDWRWMLDRADSPWYPTMRLFRQDTRGDWAGVIKRVTEELSRVESFA